MTELRSDLRHSALLSDIGFNLSGEGNYEAMFDGHTLPGDAIGAEQRTDVLLQGTGGGTDLSPSALQYLLKDGFKCDASACERDFEVINSFGTAFIPGNVNVLFHEEEQRRRHWIFRVLRHSRSGHFTRVKFSDEMAAE